MQFAETRILTGEDRVTLIKWSCGIETPALPILLVTVVLAAVAAYEKEKIAGELKCMWRTVDRWRSRIAERRMEALKKDASRSEWTPHVPAYKGAEIRKAAQETLPHATQWSVRNMPVCDQCLLQLGSASLVC